MAGLVARTFKTVGDQFVGLFYDTGNGFSRFDAGIGTPADTAAADNTSPQSLVSLARRRNNAVEKAYGSSIDAATTDGNNTTGSFFSLLKGIILGLQAIADINAPYKGVVAVPIDTTVAAARALRINCTAAGDVAVVYEDGTKDTFPVTVGLSIIPGAFTTVSSTGTTATATYANLK